MRKTLIGLLALVGAAALATAQAPVAKPAPVAEAARAAELRKHLDRWEEQMRSLRTLKAVVHRVDVNKVFRTTTKTTGWALYSKVGSGKGPTMNLAALELKNEGPKGGLAEKIISTGNYIFQWVVAAKEIRQHAIPPAKDGAVNDDNFMGLAFGMKAEAALKRYDLSLFKVEGEYVYIDVLAKSDADKADFLRARLILTKKDYLPRRLWFEAANGNEVTWDLPNVVVNEAKGIDRRYFDPPRNGVDGYKIVPAPKAGEAKPIVRPSSKR